jgi:hypothetical protein
VEGERKTFRDDDSVDLNRYKHFELIPRTTGGSRIQT